MKNYLLLIAIVLNTAINTYAKEPKEEVIFMPLYYSTDTVIYQINLNKINDLKRNNLMSFKGPVRFSYVVEINHCNYDSTATAITISINSDIRELSGIQESTCDIQTAVLIQAIIREQNIGHNNAVVIVKEVLMDSNHYMITEAIYFQKIYQGNGHFLLTPSYRLK